MSAQVMRPPAPPPETSVVELLKRLRDHICEDARSNLRSVLPAFERLLSPSEGEGVSVQHELLELRYKLLACDEDADIVEAVDRMDQVVERCLQLAEQEQQQRAPIVAVEDTMRLLLALAGGEDGNTFVLEDPTRVAAERSNTPFAGTNKRIGDRIRMHDVELVQRSRALFDKMPVPLEEENAFGNGIMPQHTSLWCPDTSTTSSTGGFISMLPHQQPNRFMGIFPNNSPVPDLFGHSLRQSNGTAKRQRDESALLRDVAAIKALRSRESNKQILSKDGVFFYDATQQVRYGVGSEPLSEWGEGSCSLTENSSWDSDSSLSLTEPWIARTYAWEDMGDRTGLSKSYCRPPVQEEKRSLRDLVIPVELSCKHQAGTIPLEIHEDDLIEDSLRVLSGVESATYRRDIPSATFKLPEKRHLKLRNATVSVTTSVLEVFRKAGTMLLRLELLAIYYSQDPTRGGKTLQAMGDALLLYISTHRQSHIETITQQCAEPTSCDVDEDDGSFSIAKLLCKTRKLCRLLEIVGHVFSCDVDSFWPLLQEGKFPRGIALLDHLHHHICVLRVEDATGRMEELMTWFLIKSCSPLLAVLSDLLASGRVDNATDPFDEFEATKWSRNVLGKAAVGGGDGLFSEQTSVGDMATGMLPIFLGEISPLIVHISQVQALLRSMDAIASTHPLVNMRPLTLARHGGEAVRHAEEWQSIVAEVVITAEETQRQQSSESDAIMSEGSSINGDEGSWVEWARENADTKRISQLKQREMLDQQVLDRQRHKLELQQEDGAKNEMQLAEEEKARADQEAYGREVLISKYSRLMSNAEERHDYMKWRRDRALRLSSAKDQLSRLHTDDIAMWAADKERRKNEATCTQPTETNAIVATSTSIAEKVTDNAVLTVAETALNGAVERLATESVAENPHSFHTAGVPSTIASTSEWRASVKVNNEAGNRSSVILGNPTSANPVKSLVRVLNEPGGGGSDVYTAIYGGSQRIPPCNQDSGEDRGADNLLAENGSSDVEMTDTSIIANPESGQGNSPVPDDCENDDSNDVAITDITQDDKERANGSDDRESVDSTKDIQEGAESVRSTRMRLPAVHPFFSGVIRDDDADILTRVMNEVRSGITETATASDEFTPFASIVNCCAEVPIRLIADKLEYVAVHWFQSSLRVVGHLRWLRKLMLMSEGLCMEIFARDFLLGLNSATRVNWGIEGRLSSALVLAMIEGSVVSDDIAQSFHYKTTPALSEVLGSIAMTPVVPKLLSEFELVYNVQWPLGLVITSQSLDHYKEMHRLLLYVRLTSLEMRKSWMMLRSIRQRGELSSSLERLCGDVIYKMQSFLRAFNETFATKVLMEAWSELECALKKATTLVELRRCHEEYVAIAVRYCFLDTAACKIHSAFTSTLEAAWRLTSFVRGLERQVTGRNAEEARMRTLCSEYNSALQTLVASLHNVSPDAERGNQELSETLLLRLNYNQYYSTEVPPTAVGMATSSDHVTPSAEAATQF